MKSIFKPMALIAVFILIFAVSSVYTQEWSEEQMEVWEQVETYWELFTNKDIEGFMNYVHPNCIAWSYNHQLPSDRESVEKWVKYDIENYTAEIYEIKLVAISTFDDVAIVYYVYTYVSSDPNGKRTSDNGCYTDILKKQEDRWVLIGWHGGSTKK